MDKRQEMGKIKFDKWAAAAWYKSGSWYHDLSVEAARDDDDDDGYYYYYKCEKLPLV